MRPLTVKVLHAYGKGETVCRTEKALIDVIEAALAFNQPVFFIEPFEETEESLSGKSTG